MDIAELRLAVARFLSGKDLTACARVCKAWYSTFHDLAWSEYTLCTTSTIFSTPCKLVDCRLHRNCLHRNVVAKNAHHIRRLILPNPKSTRHTPEYYNLFAQQCQQLQSVSFHDESRCGWRRAMAALFAANPTIQHLSTSRSECLSRAFVLPRLRVLELGLTLAVSDIMWVLQKCPHLEELILAQVLQHRARFSAQYLSTSSYGLKKLSVLQEPLSFFIYTILASCPRIESIRFLKWNTYLRQLTRTMLQTQTQHVKSIELSHHTPDSDFFSFVLEDLSHNPVRDITIHSATYATLCTMSHVYRHKVEHLVLSVSTLYAIQGVRHILNRCQALKTLRVEVGPSRFVEARTLLAAPWACLQLESLSMPLAILHTCHDDGLFKFARAEKAEVDPEGKIPEWLQAENVFMKRLGGLTQLRHLDLGIVNRSQSAKTAGFTWRFEGGLQHLAGLGRLERLRLSHVHLVQGRREVRWMRNHWRSLQRLVVHQMAHRRLFAKQWPELAIEILQ